MYITHNMMYIYMQVRPYEYDLILNSDINSDHHHQWFYFKVRIYHTYTGIHIHFTCTCVHMYTHPICAVISTCKNMC